MSISYVVRIDVKKHFMARLSPLCSEEGGEMGSSLAGHNGQDKGEAFSHFWAELMVIFTIKFGTLDPHLPIVWDKVPKKRFFLTPSLIFTSRKLGG